MIYFDNAATTLRKPKRIYKVLDEFYREYQANPSRSSHKQSIKASEKVFEAREQISSLYSLDAPENVVFTYNATYGLNLAIKTTITEKCHIIISDVEHNSVMRILYVLSERLGVRFSTFDSDFLSEECLENLLQDDTKAIISTLASNVTGKSIDETVLSSFAIKHGLKLILDASQATGHRKIDLKNNPADILCAPGHKALFGLMGSGFCVFKNKTRGISFIEGGSGSESISNTMPISLPEGYEAGTLGVPAIIALGEGIRFIKEYGEDNITKKLDRLTDILLDKISKNKKITVLGNGSGILSFIVNGYETDLLCRELDRDGFAIRSGLHCAPMAHKKLGTIASGAIRISFSVFNTEKEINLFIKSLNSIIL